MKVAFRSLRVKLLGAVALILLAVIMVSTAALTYGFTAAYTNALLSKSFTVGEAFRNSLSKSLNLGLPLDSLSGVNEKCQELTVKSGDIGYCMVTDTAGKVLFSDEPTLVGAVLNDPVSLAAARSTKEQSRVFEYRREKYYDAAVPLNDPEGKTVGVLRLGLSYNGVAAQKDRLIIRSIIIASVSLAVAMLALMFFITKLVTRRISYLVRSAARIAKGDLSETINLGSDDELGQLGQAINGMAGDLKGMLAKLKDASMSIAGAAERIALNSKKISEGSQAQQELTESTSSSMEEMNASIREVAESVESLSSSAESSSSSILQMAASIDEVADSTAELSTSAESTSSSIVEMAASVRQVADSVDVLSSAAEETTASATEMGASIKEVEGASKESAVLSEKVTADARDLGMKSVEKTIDGMEKIKDTVEKAAGVIERLGARSEEIGEILNVIDEVTDQTSLLALNAAILAAQAGEHGKGFAVVATEIKDLAERTSSSTKEIAKVISAVQSEARDAVSSIKNGKESVEEGVKIAYEAKEALEKIVESSTRAAYMSKGIEKATVEQADGIRQVSAAMMSISNMVQQILAATQEQSQGSEQIMRASEKMNGISQAVKNAMVEQAKGSKEITMAVENVSDKVQNIAAATSEQKKGSQEIVRAIAKIRDITSWSVKFAQEMDQSVMDLSAQAGILREEINRFSLTAGFALENGRLRLGVTPLESHESMRERFVPLARYLSESLGIEVDVSVAKDMGGAVDDLGSGGTDIAFLGPTTYVEARHKYGVEPIAKSAGSGAPFTRSVIVVRADSGINSVSELQGRTFAFGSEKSTSSHLMPRAMLLEAGIKLHDLGAYKYHGRHDAVARAVLAGDFDAGGMMESVAKHFMSEGLKVIKSSGEIANFNISASKKVDKETCERIRRVLLALDISDPRHAAVLRAVDPECERFMDVSDAEYDIVRMMTKKLYGIDYR